MTAPVVLSYGPDACQNWLTDALYYGTTYADQRWPLCKGGIRVMTASQPVAPSPSPAGPTGVTAPGPTVGFGPGGGGCSSCRTPNVRPEVAPIPTVPIAQPTAPAAPEVQLKGLPWWVWVLALVAGSQLFNERAA